MKFIDLGLVIGETLIISDLHIGQEEEYRKKGVLLPRFQFKDLFGRLKSLVEIVQPNVVVIAGDLKHEFGTISREEWRDVLEILDFLETKCKVVLVKGNHDTILGPIADKRGITVVDSYSFDDVLVIHGNSLPKDSLLKDIKTVVIGHEHPAIVLRERAKAERFKCFLKGKWRGFALVVLPAFNPLTEGVDVLGQKLKSPFLRDVRDFEVIIVDKGKVFPFGRVGEIIDVNPNQG